MKVQTLWSKITNLGVDETALGREVIKVRLLNQLMALAFIGSISVLISYIITQDTIVIILSTLGNVVIEISGLTLAYQKRYVLARYMGTVIFSSWVAVNVIMNGGGFGEANIFSVLVFTAFILFEGQRRVRVLSIVYITSLFIAAELYVINFSEVQQSVNPYDDIITFPLVLIALGLIIIIYQREIQKFEKRQEALINDLTDKNEKLSKLNDELEQFTYIASHDLKTPLRTINSHLDLIKRHLKKNDLQAVDEDILFAKQGAKQMYALINDILEYKNLREGNRVLAEIDLNEIINQVVRQLDVFIKEKNAEIYFDELPTIHASYKDMMVLFQNLIENGLKYNQSSTPQVHVSYEKKDEMCCLYFKDNGIGIEKEFQDKIFQFFKRLHGSNEYEGTGIGLGLCKTIIENYKGSVEVDSTGEGGSVFIVKLPLSVLVID